MKKILSGAMSLLLLLTAVLFSSCGGESPKVTVESTLINDSLSGTVLNVFNWGEYISDGSEGSVDVNAEFERLTGITVNYTTYDSNEAMYSKLKSGAVSYDIVIPSDYMIQRMISEGMLRELDYTKIDNYKYIADEYKNLYFDAENKYTAPYSVGMVGLIYNSDMVKEAPDSWSVMWDEQYKDQVLSFNNARDAYAIAQFLLGLDVNSADTADWDAAHEKLMEQTGILQGIVMDEVFGKMEGSNAAIAPYYAGDFLTMKDNNDALEFVYPKEGVNIFVDSACVPTSCQNYEAALMYINFLLEPEVALANAEYICYATPNTAVLAHESYSLKDNEILYPAKENMPKTQYFHDPDPAIRSYYETKWVEFVRALG